MTEDNPQPENTGAQVPQQPSGQQPTGVEPRRTPQDQGSGQRRNDRRDHTRYGGRRDYHRRDQPASPHQAAPKKLSVPAGSAGDIDDEEETERDRSSPQGRHYHRGGRPPKKIIEEWANDPYCE